jgi:hypothetical protein
VFRTIRLLLALVLSISAGQAAAQEWAEKMFKQLDHDFGTVARGADTVYRFEVTNLYKQTIHLTNVRSSCGCTSPTIENAAGERVPSATVKTHEKAYIVARFNTRTHVGQKGATLTVSIGPHPYLAEVQLHVHGHIRSDVVFNPGAVEFGEVYQGQASEQTVAVDYAGRSTWEIVDVTNDNDNFEVELKETQRNSNRVSYSLLVRLKSNVPVGYVKDQLTVVTNDTRAESRRIPLFVSGHVRPEFSVTPSQLVLGDVPAGTQLTKKIVVRGKEPFKIVDVTCGEECFDFKTDAESRALHFVEVTIRAGESPGKLQTPIRIITDRDNREATCLASATIVPAKTEPTTPGAEAGEAAAVDSGVRTASAP